MKNDKEENKKDIFNLINYACYNTYDYTIITYKQLVKITKLSLKEIKDIVVELENDGYIKTTIYEQKGTGRRYKTFKAYKVLKRFYE